MNQREFELDFKNWDGVPITEYYVLCRKPLSIINLREKNTTRFNTLSEAFDFVIDDGRKIADIVDTWSDMPDLVFDGETVFHIKGGEIKCE